MRSERKHTCGLSNRRRAHRLMMWHTIFKSRPNFLRPPRGPSTILFLYSLTNPSSYYPLRSPNPRRHCLHRKQTLVLTSNFRMKGAKSKANTSKKADTKLSVRRTEEKKPKTTVKKGKANKDPNKPKRPPSAFFVFMEAFRKEFKEKNPSNKSVSVVGKAGGEKWKSMSTSEKAPYVAKAEKLKVEYKKKLKAYDAGAESKKEAASDESSDKSKSEVSDEEEGSEEDDEEEDDD